MKKKNSQPLNIKEKLSEVNSLLYILKGYLEDVDDEVLHLVESIARSQQDLINRLLMSTFKEEVPSNPSDVYPDWMMIDNPNKENK